MSRSKDEQIARAVLENKRIVDYRWGTAWVSASGRYVSFAWKAWLLAIALSSIVMLILKALN